MVPTEEEKRNRRKSLLAMNMQFSNLFSSNLLSGLGISASDDSREKWRSALQQIISSQNVTSAFESLLGTSYTKLITKFGYVFEKEIGQGAFGKVPLLTLFRSTFYFIYFFFLSLQVYRAKANDSGLMFAIKSFEKDSMPMVLEQFNTEKAVLQSLPSEFRLVTLHETLEDDTHFYLVLEYCAGGDLYSLVEHNVISEASIKQLAAEAAIAIHVPALLLSFLLLSTTKKL